jgi:peroxiredoxin
MDGAMDKEGMVRYVGYVPEIAHHPNYGPTM